MKYNLLLSRKILPFISILGFIVLLAGAVFKISHWIFVGLTGNILIAIGLFLTLFAWFFVLIDVIRNKTTELDFMDYFFICFR